MAFCNSCGTTLDAGTKFCNKCGAAVSAPAATAVATPGAPPPPKQGSSTLKIVLIIVAVFVVLGIIGVSAIGFMAWRVAKSSHVTEKNGKVTVESPFGNMEANSDPAETAKNLGVDLYPGAEVQKNGSVSMTIMGMHTATAVLNTSDSASQVADFYHEKMPTAHFTGQGDSYSLSSGDRSDMTTVIIQGNDGTTKIQITRVTKAKD